MRIPIYFHFPIILILSLPLTGETARNPTTPAEVGSIRVVIRENIDTPLLHGQIRVTPMKGSEEPKTVSADSDGYYRIVGLPPGNYRVTATVPGYGNQEKSAQVKKYKSTQLTMKVRKRV